MTKKSLTIILVGLFTLILPLTGLAQTEGIALQQDVFLGEPISGPEDLPDEVTFNLYDSETALTPIGTQTFPKGEYTVDFEFSKSDGLTSGNVARVNAKFTNKLNLKDDPDSSAQVKELWVDVAVDGTEIAGRTKVSDESLVQLLLASDASIATYLTLVYEGDDNPLTTIYKDLPLSSLASDSSGSALSNYFSTLTGNLSDRALTDPNNWYPTAGGDICYLQGYVGIGTSVPNAHLDMRSDRAVLKMDATKGTYDYPRMKGYADRPNSGQGVGSFEWWNNAANPVAAFYVDRGTTDSMGQLSFWTSNSPRMRIDQNGKVGIGTTTPTYELAVNGTIRCKELIVDTGWSDFVFEDTYRLPSLSEVEQFINENKHLPGIPSEDEVKKNGVSVGNISSKLLQKIEELTLYVIKLKNENDSLKSQVAAIQKQLNYDGNRKSGH